VKNGTHVYICKRVVFHSCLALIPGVVSGFVAFVVSSPITDDTRLKAANGAIALFVTFFVFFTTLCLYYGLDEGSYRFKLYRGKLIEPLARLFNLGVPPRSGNNCHSRP